MNITDFFEIRRPMNNEYEDNDGNRCKYDGTSEQPLNEAKEFYKNMEHVHSGYVTYHNGVKNTWEKLHHFFVFTNPSPINQ